MNKGIIIMDIPKSCDECPCYKEGYIGDWDATPDSCRITGEEIYSNTIEEDCPIKPMPEKIEHKSRQGLLQEQVALGWNLCIDEILEEAK